MCGLSDIQMSPGGGLHLYRHWHPARTHRPSPR
uniref:Uncharacterized protein n=1 Tax=Arundo donax TaxID=35708 RepID=A0A0A8ZS55_ARUDO